MIKKAALLLTLMTALTGCARETVVPRDVYAVLCIDPATQIRTLDSACRDQDGYRWAYVSYHESWPLELPSIGRPIENGRYTWERDGTKSGMYIAKEGGRFADK